MKLLAIGKPANVYTFLQELHEREGIVSDVDSFDSNPARCLKRKWTFCLVIFFFTL
jgi:hypothetical protein